MTADPAATSSTRRRAAPIVEDPRLTAFLPLLYVAWADGDLSAEEIEAICVRARAVGGIGTDCQDLLGSWLDPDDPPSARELQALLRGIRRRAAELSVGERRSLTELGLELAQVDGLEIPREEQVALEEIDRALGVSSGEVTRQFLPSATAEEPVPPQASFDVERLAELLAGEARELRLAVRELLSGEEFRYRYGLDKETYRDQVLTWCRRLASEGYGALSFPEAYGGGDDTAAFVAAFETVAEHDLSLLVKFGVQFGLFGGAIHQLGTEHHHEAYLRDLASLDLPGCFAMTESGHGSNVQQIETVARYLPASQEWEVHTPNEGARKDYIGNAARHGRLAVVFAQLEVGEEDHGVHALVVPIRDLAGRPLPGVTIEDCGEKMGLNGVDNGRLYFDRVRVPRRSLLDRFASVSAEGEYSSPIASANKRFFTMLGTLVGGRVSVALASLSATKSALAIAVRYASRRRQFGPTGGREVRIMDYLTHQRRLLPRLASTYALHFALRDLAKRYAAHREADAREVEAMAAGLKAVATWHATDTIQASREACGGNGYLAVNRFARLKADTDVFTTFEGDNTVLLQLVAKSLLSGFRRQFSEAPIFGLVKYLAAQAATAVAELNPVVTRLVDPEHLRDGDFHLSAFRWREEHLVSTVARRMKKRLDAGADSFSALVDVQDHLVEAAAAHVDRRVLESFTAAIGALKESAEGNAAEESSPAEAQILERLRALYALSRIEDERGWYLEQGYLEPPKAKAVRKEVNRLCRELRPDAVALVDAFGIPDALLAAPIAT